MTSEEFPRDVEAAIKSAMTDATAYGEGFVRVLPDRVEHLPTFAVSAARIDPKDRAQCALCIVDGAHLISKMAELLLGNREADAAAKRGGLASGFRRLAARLEHIGREGPPDFREVSPEQLAVLEWLPDPGKHGASLNNYQYGWNACLDAIRKHREPVKPKTI